MPKTSGTSTLSDNIISRGYKLREFKVGTARYDINMAQEEAAKWRVSGYWAQVIASVSINRLYIKPKKLK